ncbi:MAG: hypothetical protein FWF65_09920 [Bacteroidetes bacterium]|nr:hypothetical protein [Bacteroidota bacterium]
MDFVENIRDIRIGNIIEEKLIERSMTKTEFAKKINRSRSDVNDILKRKSIDTNLLIEISKTLEYDFIRSIYYGEQPLTTVFIAVKVKEEEIQKMNLQEKFIQFLKPKK